MRRAAARLTILLVGVLLATLLGGASTAGAAPRDVPDPGKGPYFGPQLDWTKDSAEQYARRLGVSPSLFAQSVRYPLGDDDRTYLRQFVEQSSQHGALDVLTLAPTKPLEALTEADARSLARSLDALHERYDATVLVKFAPEMNGSWQPWGQQPEAYRAAFRIVAEAVHAEAKDAVMVWSPSYGAGYPFARSVGATKGSGPRVTAQLDTNDDGRVDRRDDAYAPYWPGAQYVDWVGLSLYHYGARQTFDVNAVPAQDEFADRLQERFGYGDERERASFYTTYAERYGLPMAVQTGAYFNKGGAGDATEIQIKRNWWRQVLDPTTLARYPLIEMVSWQETRRKEAEAGGAVVDWRATHTKRLAAALLDDLRADDARTGGVTRVLDQATGNASTTQYRDDGLAGDEMGWIVFCAVLAFALLLISGVVGRLVPSWRYPREDDPRDQRLDFFRGWTIVAVVVTHVEVAGIFSYVTLNAIGAITGAEMFVLLSGVVLGMVHPAAVARFGEYAAAIAALKRARKQYLTALVVVVLVPLLGLLPYVTTRVVTTFTDRGTGADGVAARGQVYDLYANFPRLLDYPLPWYAAKQLLLLEMGPWVFNIMGLFVVLSAAFPALMFLVRRRLWWLVLALSWGLYAFQRVHPLHLLPSQFEDVFPLFIWQVPFCTGIVIGYYRRQITRALTTRLGKAGVTLVLGAYVGVLALLWAGHRYGFEVPLAGPDTYADLYTRFFQRTDLQLGRLVDLLLVLIVAYALLTTCWKPLNAAFGWFYTPLGRVSLYVFIVHVFFVIAVGNIPHLDRTNVWIGTAVHAVVLGLIWVMVKKKVLARIIPA